MSRQTRKLDHLRLARLSREYAGESFFDDLSLVHRSLPETILQDVSLATRLGAIELPSPLIINAMTGGVSAAERINRDLAVIARETGIALAVGSQKAALQTPSLAKTYQIVREVNPRGIVMANISADSTADDAMRAVDMIRADLLQLHLNMPQELVMPEGRRSFLGIGEKISRIIEGVRLPVIVKETGFGMCRETFGQLEAIGVSLIDLSGRGGTNFIRVENQRRKKREYSFLYDWGQTTVVSLLESLSFQDRMQFISSGGVRHSLDMIKSLTLGACAVGLAGPILGLLQDRGTRKAIEAVADWHDQLRVIMTMLGASTIPELRTQPVVITGRTKAWCDVRGIDVTPIASGRNLE